jgi:hypothetical protein
VIAAADELPSAPYFVHVEANFVRGSADPGAPEGDRDGCEFARSGRSIWTPREKQGRPALLALRHDPLPPQGEMARRQAARRRGAQGALRRRRCGTPLGEAGSEAARRERDGVARFDQTRPGSETCNAWYERFKAHRRKDVGTVDDDARRWSKWIAPKIGTKPIVAVTPDDMDDIRDALTAAVLAYEAGGNEQGEGRLAPKTAQNVWAALTTPYASTRRGRVGRPPSPRRNNAVATHVLCEAREE